MRIQRARLLGGQPNDPCRCEICSRQTMAAARAMAAALDEIEQVCARQSPGHPAVEQIASIVAGESTP